MSAPPDPLAAPLPPRLVLAAASVPACLVEQGPSEAPTRDDGMVRLDLEIADGRIAQASFEARACAPVIAVASFGTEILVGLTLDETRELQILEWDRKLGGLPPSKRHAYLMFLESLQDAKNYHNL